MIVRLLHELSIQRMKKWGNIIILLAFLLTMPLNTAEAQNTYKLNLPVILGSNDSPPLTTGAYYVSPSGSDSNPGTQSRPWKTISKAASKAGPGKTVYVRGGTYKEKVRISIDGTESAPVKFLAYPNEKPIIEGSHTLPTSYDGLISVKADWVTVSGFEVRNSQYIGVALYGKHDTVSNSYVHHSEKSGILLSGDYGSAISNRSWRNSILNEYGNSSTWSTGITASRDSDDGLTQYAVIRNNVVWENWGQGISTYESDHTIIQDNISHDNYVTNIYLSDTTNTVCQRNFVYMNPSSYVYGNGANVGIMMGDEKMKPASSGNKILNNIAYNNRRNFFWWQGSGRGLVNTVIAGNTFYNASDLSNFQLNEGQHENVLIANNIIHQDGSVQIAGVGRNSQLRFTNNLWSSDPPSAAEGSGTIVGNPRFTKSGGSPFESAFYQISGSSPAINKGIVHEDLTVDFARIERGSKPDIGAFEYVP